MGDPLQDLHRDLRALVGKTFADRYRIDSLLGVGGMAAVFRAHHLGLKRDVAIKILHPNLTPNAEISGRFEREAESASRLDHPNTVQVTDFGSTPTGIKFMVMQLLEGVELADVLRGTLTPRRAVNLVLQILRGLDHAHKRGVIHRDVKPENVFVTRDADGREVLKLVDFGISKMVGREGARAHKTTTGLVFGTPAYMSPEQAAGMEADHRADLYSVGVMLYQMLAGSLPFDSDDMVALVRMQVGRDPDPLPASVPPVLAGVVEKLMIKDREGRFQSAAEVIETLESLEPLLEVQSTSSDPAISERMPRRGSGPSRVETPSGPLLRIPSDEFSSRPYASTRSFAEPPPRSVARSVWLIVAGVGVLMIGAASSLGFDGYAVAESLGIPGFGETRASEESSLDEAERLEPVLVPAPEALLRIDGLIAEGKLDEAEELLNPLRDEFPDDSDLLWRQGRLLTQRKGKQSQALAAYAGAIGQSPALLDTEPFASELGALMRTRRVRDEALDLALQKMGSHGHPFLLELVNDQKHPLPYHDRRRALEELARDPANATAIDRQLNMALDLLQAAKSLTPCLAYREALDAIAAAPAQYFVPRVEKAKVPEEPGPGIAGVAREVPEECPRLAARRDEVLAMLVNLPPEAPPEEPEPMGDVSSRVADGSSPTDSVDGSPRPTGADGVDAVVESPPVPVPVPEVELKPPAKVTKKKSRCTKPGSRACRSK